MIVHVKICAIKTSRIENVYVDERRIMIQEIDLIQLYYLLAFSQFPAEHWQQSRTTNPIESTCATVRLRTGKTRSCLSRATALTMAFQLVQWCRKNMAMGAGLSLIRRDY